MKAKVVNFYNNDVFYGFLTVENASVEKVQTTIREIINKLYHAGFDEWDIDDISKHFPKEWKWNFISCNVDCIVEI